MSLAVLGVLGGLFALTGIDSGDNGDSLAPFGYVLIVIAYIAFAFVAVFFQAALVSGANARLDGRDTSVKESIAAAGSKVHRLLPWAIVQATVSFIINQLERQEIIGALIGSLLGAAWNILTFLAIPIIVIEDVGPGGALKRSKTLLGRTWGENVSAQLGFGLLGFVAVIPAALARRDRRRRRHRAARGDHRGRRRLARRRHARAHRARRHLPHRAVPLRGRGHAPARVRRRRLPAHVPADAPGWPWAGRADGGFSGRGMQDAT